MGPGELGRRRTWRGATSRQRLLQVLLGGTVRSQSRSRGRTHLSAHLRLSCWSLLRVTQVHGEVTSVSARSIPRSVPWRACVCKMSRKVGRSCRAAERASGSGELLRQKPVGADGPGRGTSPLHSVVPPSPSLPAHTCPLPVSFRLTPILTHQGPVPIPLSGESGPTGRRLHRRASPRLERRGESWG